MLSSNQWKQQHSRIFNLRYPGTGTWILTNRIFDQWKMATGTHQQRCLWCYGIRKNVQPNSCHISQEIFTDNATTNSWLRQDHSHVSV